MLIRTDGRIKIIPELTCFVLVQETFDRFTLSIFVVRFSVFHDYGPVLVALLCPDKFSGTVLYTNNSNLCYKSYFNNVPSYGLKFS
jgi:hypothetical protein